MKLVLLKLADRANDDGECWPGMQSVAQACGVCERTMMRHIDAMAESGLIERVKRKDDSGRQMSNLYRLNIDNKPGDRLSPGNDEPGDISNTNRVTSVSPVINEETTVLNHSTHAPTRERMPKWAAKALEVTLPECLNPKAWNAYIKHRVELKAKLTSVGVERLLARIIRMHNAGQPISQVIARSIENGWTGLFDIPTTTPRGADGIEALRRKGDEMGLYAKPGESVEDFARRIQNTQRSYH